MEGSFIRISKPSSSLVSVPDGPEMKPTEQPSVPEVSTGKPPVLLNDIYAASRLDSANRQFTCFARLPVELRLCVWEMSMQRNRIVMLVPWLLPLPQPPGRAASQQAPRYRVKNMLGKVISGFDYQVLVRGLSLPALLGVSREARGAAMRFYRVHLPGCVHVPSKDWDTPYRSWEQPVSGPRQPGVLLINPEYDYISMNVSTIPGSNCALFLDLLHDLKAHDPKDIGVRNLIVHYHMHFKCLEPDILRHDIAAVLCGLRNLWFHLPPPSENVCRFPGRHFSDNNGSGRRDVSMTVPLGGWGQTFDLLDDDPRPIGSELEYVRMPKTCWPVTPRPLPHEQWQRIEELLGVVRRKPLNICYLKSAYWSQWSPRLIMDCTSLFERVATEAERQQNLRPTGNRRLWRSCAVRNDGGAASRTTKVDIPLAYGFWVFDNSALATITQAYYNFKTCADLSAHPPKLCLLDLP